jgi:23S rRNA G2445 N2-methylase RlmL
MMPIFFATCPRGLEKVLERELQALEINKTKIGIAGVSFNTNWAGCYLANLELVSASPDQIYHHVLKHDWTKYIKPTQTIAMDSKVRDSIIRDLRIVALKAKDAVVDQFRDKFGVRPNVDSENPDLQVSLRLVKNMCTVSLDTSGGSLHLRGYRDRSAPAPLKENLAAALVKMSGWDQKSPLMDPMCGSGTICVEAALMALKIPVGTFRKKFGFEKWMTFQPENFKKLSEQIASRELSDIPFRIYGSDADGRAVSASKENADNAGVSTATIFRRQDISEFEPAPEKGVLITNPPYGERMGEVEALVPLYQTLGEVLKNKFSGWTACVLSGSPELTRAIGIKPHERHRVFNGSIQCEFLKFKL